MSQTTTRPICEADLSGVLRMVYALAEHHGDSSTLTLETLHRDALGAAPWLTFLVAERSGDLAGYAALCPLAQLQFGVRGMDMHHLFVAPDMRGMGVGRMLIEASVATSKTRGCRYVTVGTHPENSEARQVYLAAGFDPLPPPGPRFRMKI